MKKTLLLFFLLTFFIGHSQNKILNGTFAAGTANWGFGSPGVVASGEAYYSTANAGAPTYGTELKQTGLTLTSGAVYTITFRARAAANRLLSVNIQNTNVWNDHFRNDAVALTTTMTTYSYSFTATSVSNSANNVQLNFHMAGLGTNTTSAVYIDDVSIMPGNVTATPCFNGIQDNGETGVDCGGTCAACLATPTYGVFTVPAKFTNSAAFALTPPTSTNTSSFTYTSSNTAVASVSGSTVTIVGAGSSTITANQVSDGTYSAGSTTATLVVTVPLPASAAPSPPARNTWDVISYYSDTNVGSVYAVASAPTWGGQTADAPISGNATKFLGSYLFGQIAFANKNVSAMTTLHIDLYSVDQTTTWVWLNNSKYIVTPVTTGVWTSLDIPLSTFTVADQTAINIVKIESPTGAATPLRNVYVDNIYFYRSATDAPPTIGALTVPSPKVLGDAAFTLTNPTSTSSGAWTYSSSPAGVVTFSGNTATIVGGGTTTITATQAAVPGVFGAGTASASLVVTYPAPGASPVPPLRDAASVVSLYTGTPTTYADVRTAIQASWSTGSTTSNFSYANGSNTCIQVNNLGYFGLVGNTNFSVVGMTKLHVDIYVNSPMTTMILNLLAPADRNYSIGPLVTGWNSFDIPLTTYPGVLTDIAGIKFEQSGGTPRQIYIDNVYFYYTPTTPTISNFAAVAKVMGAAPFTLGATSDSPATITYTSSNTAVATISGNTVTVVGVGTSTLTASQVATGSYGAGSLNATLTVTGSSVPLVGPTAPPARNAWDVFSVFSDAAYTVVPGTRNYNPSWGQAGSAAVITAGTDNVWRASNLNYQGIVMGSNVDVSAMTHFHVDVWTFDETSLQFFQISNTTGERSVALAAPYGALTQGSWVSYDIPLTAWTSQSGFTTTALKEFKIVGSGGKTVYMDNMYFYRPATTLPPTLGTFTVPAKLVGDAAFVLTPPTSNSAGAFTYTSSNTSVATISGDTVTILGAGSSTITATQAADGSYGSRSTTATLSVTPAAAPTPIARNTWDVISLYSDAYATSSAASWGAGTDVSISGNNTRVLSGSPTYRLAFTATDVSAMTKLHIDVYALDQSSWQFRLNDKAVTVGTPVNGWTSVDILLSAYVPLGLNLSTVSYFDFFNPNGANPNTSYVDNIYFYRDATLPPATVGTFTVPAKVLGDAPFTLTPPTSNNTSPFTYSSSDTAIATISGSTLTVVGGGTATITASQVADGTYGPTSKTASLVVTYPAPSASPVPPARDPAKVVSMYTGTPAVYTNAITTTQASWSTGSTTSNFSYANGTNTCIQVNNLGYIGLATNGANFSVAGMTNLHIDIYLNSPISYLILNLLAPSDRNYTTGPLVAGWNSLSIPLSTTYPGSLTNIYGVKIEQNVGAARQIYIDNVYFSNDTYYADTDGDGYGDANTTVLASTQPSGYVLNNTDCDDTNIAIYRNGDFYVDNDNDGFNNGGPQSTACYGASAPTGFTANNIGTDCDDYDTEINPNHVEVLDNGIDDNCDGNVDEVAPTSSLQPNQCGITLTNMSQTLYANVVTGAIAAQGFRFEATEVSNPSNVRTYDSANNRFNLNNLVGGGVYNTTYSIRVAVKTAPGFWRSYAAACTVTTPAVAATTKVHSSQCGITLTNIAATIYCDAVTNASGYRFRITDGVTTQTYENTVNRFSLSSSPLTVNFATTYAVDVQLKFGTTWETTWGTVCNITTPATPGTSNVTPSQCGMNIPNLWTTIYATQVAVATGYRFEITKSGGGTVFYDTPNARFSLRNITVPGFTTTNASYSIRVSLLYNSIYQAFGNPCTITTNGASRITNKPLEVFEVNAYPNPFANNFKLEVNTSSEENVRVKVYDMLGRAIEVKQGNLSDMTSSEMGDQLTSGVYNVIVTQGEHVKTLRMIKR